MIPDTANHHPKERLALDYLENNPGATISDAALHAGVYDEENTLLLVARLIWHKHLPVLLARVGVLRVVTLPAALAAAEKIIEDDQPIGCNDRAHSPECFAGHDVCGRGRDEAVEGQRLHMAGV